MVADAPLATLGKRTGGDAEALRPQEGQNAVDARVTIKGVMAMLERQDYRCALTGRRLEPEVATLDHIIPLRCGGQHVLENTQVLHKDVNRAKGSMTTEEFLDLCREVVRFSTCAATRKDERKRAG